MLRFELVIIIVIGFVIGSFLIVFQRDTQRRESYIHERLEDVITFTHNAKAFQAEQKDVLQKLSISSEISILQSQLSSVQSQMSTLGTHLKELSDMVKLLPRDGGGTAVLGDIQHQIKALEKQTTEAQSQLLKVPYLYEYELPPIKKVFFDLGANYGDSSLQFSGLERVSNLGGAASEQVFKLGKNLGGKWDMRVYEAHPKFDSILMENRDRILKANVEEYGGPFTIYLFNSTAIGSHEGEIEFFLDTRSSVTWGSSLIKEHPDVNMSKEASVVKVPMHDLAKEIMSNYRISDYVVIKMDIEGIEGNLLTNLLLRGAFPYIDELYVEYHTGLFLDNEKKDTCMKYVTEEAVKSGFLKAGPWQK